MEAAEKQKIINSTKAEWEREIALLIKSKYWATIWDLVPLAPAIRSKDLISVLKQTNWLPNNPLELAHFEELKRLEENWSSSDGSGATLQTKFLACNLPVEQFAFSPDRRYLVTTRSGSYYSNQIQLWEIEPWKLVHTIDVDYTPQILSVSNDSKVLAAGCYQDLRLFSMPGLQALRSLGPLANGPCCIKFSPLGNYLFASGADGMIRFWSLDDPTFFARFRASEDDIQNFAFDRSGTWLATPGANGVVNIWSLASGEIVQKLQAHKESIQTLMIALNSAALVTIGRDHNELFHEDIDTYLRCWSAYDWTRINQKAMWSEQLTADKCGKALAALCDLPWTELSYKDTIADLNAKKVSILDPFSTECIAEFELDKSDYSMSQTILFSADGEFLAINTPQGLRLYPRGFGVSQNVNTALDAMTKSPTESLSQADLQLLERSVRTDWIHSPLRESIRFANQQILLLKRLDETKSVTDDLIRSPAPTNLPNSGVTKCQTCASEISVCQRLCYQCGTNLVGFAKLKIKKSKLCPHYFLVGAKKCEKCGVELNGAADPAKKKVGTGQRIYKGTCQICGVITAVGNEKSINEHDYSRSWNFLTGRCPGSNQEAFENSIDYLSDFLNRIELEANDLKAQAAKILSNTTSTVMRIDPNSDDQAPTSFVLSHSSQHIWRHEARCKELNDAIASYNSWTASPLLSEARERDAFILWHKTRIKAWKISDLFTSQDKDSMQQSGRDRTLAIRASKRQIEIRDYKENKDLAHSDDEVFSDEPREQKFGDDIDLFDPDYSLKAVIASRVEAIVNARLAFLLGSVGMNHSVWSEQDFYKQNIRDLKSFQTVFSKYPWAAPELTCAHCNGLLNIEHGELRCREELTQNFSFEQERIVLTLSLIARAFDNNTEVVHLLIEESGWVNLGSWEQARAIFQSGAAEPSAVYCGTCKASLSFYYSTLKCECPVNKVDQRILPSASDIESVTRGVQNNLEKFQDAILSKPSSNSHDDDDDEIENTTEPSDGDESTNDDEATRLLFDLIPKTQNSFLHWLRCFQLCEGYEKLG